VRIATFNINNINRRLPNLLPSLNASAPDVVCLQELKCAHGDFPIDAIRKAGYHAVRKGERSWNGVAILARKREPILIRDMLPGNTEDEQSRYIEAAVDGIAVASIYLPNGSPQPGPKFKYKLEWFDRLIDHAAELLVQDVPAVLAGDYNVVPTDFDIYATRSYKDNALLQPAPRAANAKLLTAGWVDAMRTVYPDDPMFTFWSYLRNRWFRNAGLRLDHLLLSPAVAPRLKAAGVDRNVRSEPEASDHAPAWIELKSARRGGTKRNRRSPP
jgi:exodeoxyribonuclease III